MQLIYRGILYEAQPSAFKQSDAKLRMSSSRDELGTTPSSTMKLKYRGLAYTTYIEKSNASTSDPDLESFIAAFWAIVDA